MLLNAKKLAFMGLLLAVTVVLIILSGVFEFNTLFLLAAASFGVGIAIRESSLRIGAGFYLAAVLLSIMLAPNKLYIITFVAMGLYIVIIEYAFDKLAGIRWKHNDTAIRNRSMVYWGLKYLIFNLMFIPILLFLPKLIYPGKLSIIILGVLLFGGQVALFLFDAAYRYFQGAIWGKIRSKLKL